MLGQEFCCVDWWKRYLSLRHRGKTGVLLRSYKYATVNVAAASRRPRVVSASHVRRDAVVVMSIWIPSNHFADPSSGPPAKNCPAGGCAMREDVAYFLPFIEGRVI